MSNKPEEFGVFSSRKQKRDKRRKGFESRVNEGLVNVCLNLIHTSETIMDIGAAYGAYVKVLASHGYTVLGIDGTSGIEDISEGLVREVNLLDREQHWLVNSVDWGIFFEVGAHIPPEYEDILIDQVSLIPKTGLIVTWEAHGQKGHNHLNCRTEAYVASEFRSRGWYVDDTDTHESRQLIGKKFRSRLLVLRK